MIYGLKTYSQTKYKNLLKSNAKRGFTLAEILVVITIIGVIAMQAIPSLVQDIKENLYKTGYKKAFSDLSNVLINPSR